MLGERNGGNGSALKSPTVLLDDPGSALTWWLTTFWNSVIGDLSPLVSPTGAKHACVTDVYV